MTALIDAESRRLGSWLIRPRQPDSVPALGAQPCASVPAAAALCHLVAKGVLTSPDQLHISYMHTPVRYA